MPLLDRFYETLIHFCFRYELSTTQVIAHIIKKSCPSDRNIQTWLETLQEKIYYG